MSFSPAAIFSPEHWNHAPMSTFTAAMPSWIAPKPEKEPNKAWPAAGLTGAAATPPAPLAQPENDEEPAPPLADLEESRFPSMAVGALAAHELPAGLEAPPLPRVSLAPIDLDAIEARHAEQIEALRQQVAQALSALELARPEVLAASKPEVVRLALAVAERVVGHELRTDPGIVERWVQQGLEHMSDEDKIAVVVAPDVADKLGEEPWRRADGAAVSAQVDPALPAGHCELRGKFCRVDASVKARLAAVARELDVEER
jgi:Flagellar assembly protein FliH